MTRPILIVYLTLSPLSSILPCKTEFFCDDSALFEVKLGTSVVVGESGSVVGERQSSGSDASDWMRADLTKFLAIDSISAS